MDAHIFILNFALTSHCSKLGEEHTYEIKHDIHPEKWVHIDRFNIKQTYGDISALSCWILPGLQVWCNMSRCTEDAYSSGHLVLSHFGTCMRSNVETNLSWTCRVSGLLNFEHPSVLLFCFQSVIRGPRPSIRKPIPIFNISWTARFMDFNETW